ncbi:hypothetical protein ACTJKK_03135 [Microbacterium sp. 22179]|uniref:hypothetical protein n=1 Tax=Microbacterium sp. 22179 TaxID=3453886 RepID=UPI003F832760
MNTTLSVVNLQVFRLRASRADDVELHVDWSVTYSTTAVATELGDAWPLLATIHAGGVGGWADITVSGILKNAGSATDAHWEDELGSSEALETLYDFARSHLGPLLMTVDAEVPLPKTSPQVDLRAFAPSDEDEDNVEVPGEADFAEPRSVETT